MTTTLSAYPQLTPAESARFWDKVIDAGQCRQWTGAVTSRGYGCLGVTRERPHILLAHRVAWEMEYGSIPGDLTIDHAVCGNRLCVNTSHLEIVTLEVNMWRGKGHRWAQSAEQLIHRVVSEPTLIRMSDVAGVLGMGGKTVRRMVASGELPQIVHGHHNRYVRRDDLLRLIVSRATEDAWGAVLRTYHELVRAA
jgi:hypothetical protein